MLRTALLTAWGVVTAVLGFAALLLLLVPCAAWKTWLVTAGRVPSLYSRPERWVIGQMLRPWLVLHADRALREARPGNWGPAPPPGSGGSFWP